MKIGLALIACLGTLAALGVTQAAAANGAGEHLLRGIEMTHEITAASGNPLDGKVTELGFMTAPGKAWPAR